MLKSFARVKGKYIALCEGDDYWCDENKLQMQYDYMEKNSNCTLCVHGTNVHNVKTNTMSKLEPFSKDYDLNIEYFLKNNPNFHTSSFFFPSYLVKQLPDFYEISPIGDLPFKMLFISSGYCHYINKIMSVYTWFTAGSWSERKSVESIIKKREYIDQMIEVYKSFNKYTNYKYQDLVDEQILKYNFRFYKETSNVKEIKKPEYYPLYKKLPLIDRLKISLKGIPIVFSIYNKFRK